MRVLAKRLGNPERAFATLHVTGTNGKSATARAAATLYRLAGRRVGLYTSPHVFSVRERIEIDGAPITPDALEEALVAVARAAHGLELGFFETITAAGMLAFARAGVELAVVEVGILGRFDPTNIVASEVAVVTNVGHDHLDYAGTAPGAVAFEKAGIVKETTHTCVAGQASAELLGALRSQLEATSSPARLVVAGGDFVLTGSVRGGFELRRRGRPPLELGFGQRFEAMNAALGLVAVEAALGRPLGEGAGRAALGGARLVGRAQVVSNEPFVLADVAHNPEAADTLRGVLDEALASRGLLGGRSVFVVGMTGARSPEAFLRPLLRDGDLVVACPTTGSPGAVEVLELAGAARALGARAVIATSAKEALAMGLQFAKRDGSIAATVVTGSFRVVAALCDSAGRLGFRGLEDLDDAPISVHANEISRLDHLEGVSIAIGDRGDARDEGAKGHLGVEAPHDHRHGRGTSDSGHVEHARPAR
jgi:dihydrofolate synthase/folylpolyglutamate synthase